MQMRRAEDRGHANHGWLDSFHTFSFGSYHDPAHMGHGPLRVLNQDVVAGGQGFGQHGHRDMEIVSVVLDGVLVHEDSMGHRRELKPGEVQLMSAGKGVRHGEANGSAEAPVHFLQMWVLPERKGSAPRYEQKDFPLAGPTPRLVVDPQGCDGALTIGRDARLWIGRLAAGEEVRLPASGRQGWFHLATGALRVGDQELKAGDGGAFQADELGPLRGSAEDSFWVAWDYPQPEGQAS